MCHTRANDKKSRNSKLQFASSDVEEQKFYFKNITFSLTWLNFLRRGFNLYTKWFRLSPNTSFFVSFHVNADRLLVNIGKLNLDCRDEHRVEPLERHMRFLRKRKMYASLPRISILKPWQTIWHTYTDIELLNLCGSGHWHTARRTNDRWGRRVLE